MIHLLIIIFLASLVGFVIAWFWWPADKRSRKHICFAALLLSSVSGITTIIVDQLPVHRQEIVEKVIRLKYEKPPQIIEKDKIIYRIPGKEFDPVDVKATCSGRSPVIIKIMDVSDRDKESRTTWVTGHIPGSNVVFVCSIPGDFSGLWHVGDTVQFVRGTAQ